MTYYVSYAKFARLERALERALQANDYDAVRMIQALLIPPEYDDTVEPS